ncbi:MAG: class II aldolase/adducin family protein [Planctomycetota bacterium]
MSKDTKLSPPTELVELSNELGSSTHDYVILGEGNTSTPGPDGSFWVKASGSQLGTMGAADFVLMQRGRVLEMLTLKNPTDDQVRGGLLAAKVGGSSERLPSVETAMHAVLLNIPGVRFVGHTHPTAINAITCSVSFNALRARLFPDEVVLCGAAPVLVPYFDPGLPLAHEIQRRVEAYLARYGERPKTIYLQNHGFIALGATAREVLHITAMAVKAARILLGAFALGGPNYLSAKAVARIHGRPDEHYRQRMLGVSQPEAVGDAAGVDAVETH